MLKLAEWDQVWGGVGGVKFGGTGCGVVDE